MKMRVLAVVCAVTAVLVWLILAVLGRQAQPTPNHGSFSSRLQPQAPVAASETARVAGIGTIKGLQPVDMPSR